MFRSFFLITVFLFVTGITFSQQKSAIVILAKSKADGIWLRWAPTDPTYWQLGNKYGYSIERFTLMPDGELESNSQISLTSTPLKPYTRAEFLPVSDKSDEVATLEELLYGEDFNTPVNENNMSSILAKNNEQENRYGIAILMCDLSLDAAKAGGLFFKDTKAIKGKRYIYRFTIAQPATAEAIDPVVSIVNATDEKPMAEIKDLTVEFADKTASISWSTLLHKGIYSAYFIEKSADGKTFTKLTDLPYVHMSEKIENETAFFVDSLESNLKKYYYRIRGISPFAEVGPYSNVVSGEGKESLFGLLILREGKTLDKRQAKLTWEFPKQLESRIAGFIVSRAGNPDGPYIDIQKKTLSKDKREYTDVTGFNNTYYIVKAIDKDGKEITRSFPYLVQIEDNTPPAIPVDIKGSIEKTGITSLSWKANTDADLLGYRIFRSNSMSEEPVEVTQDIMPQPLFTDTVNTRVLNKDIYYFVIAVDKNFNTSNYSAPFKLLRPDVLSPAAPVFTRTELRKDTIILEWINSASQDVAKYELSRLDKTSGSSSIINSWTSASLIKKYNDRSLTPGNTYHYKITAYDSAGNKSETTSREIIFEPGYRASVTNIKSAVDKEGKKITLQWKNSGSSVKCIIYRKVNDKPFTIYLTIDGFVESFTDQRISINNTYSYKVQAIFPKGVKSLISEEIKVIY